LLHRAKSAGQELTQAQAEEAADLKLAARRKSDKEKPYIYVAVRFRKEGKNAPIATEPGALHGHRRFGTREFEDAGPAQMHGSRLQIADSYNKWLTATEVEGQIQQPDQVVWKREYNVALKAHFVARSLGELEVARAIQNVIINGENADGYEVIRPLLEQAH